MICKERNQWHLSATQEFQYILFRHKKKLCQGELTEPKTQRYKRDITMNLPILQDNNVKTMSSREMAALCEKRHDNTLLVIRDLEKRGLLENSRPQNYVHAQNGQQYVEYLSDKRDSLVIVARLSPEFMAAVIDRWQELEQQAVKPVIPQTLPEALRLAADLAEQNAEQQERLALAEPKAAALDEISAAEGSLNARDTAKTLGVKPGKFNAWAIAHKWMYKDSQGKLQPHSHRVQQGFMTMRPVTYKGRNGDKKATTQAMFTPRGLVRLAEIFAIVREVA